MPLQFIATKVQPACTLSWLRVSWPKSLENFEFQALTRREWLVFVRDSALFNTHHCKCSNRWQVAHRSDFTTPTQPWLTRVKLVHAASLPAPVKALDVYIHGRREVHASLDHVWTETQQTSVSAPSYSSAQSNFDAGWQYPIHADC